jgi:hypothetical protein
MIDLTKYKKMFDVWYGNGQYVESIIKAGDVDALAIRVNTTNGELRYDPNFLINWKEASIFDRMVYLVIDPNIPALDYFKWTRDYIPPECKIIGPDIEIGGVDPAIYSKRLTDLYAMVQDAGRKILQYSGYGYYPLVKPWVKGVRQWWARYLNSVAPPIPVVNGIKQYPSISYAELDAKLSQLSWTPLVPALTEEMTGDIVAWQVTSRYHLPGFEYNSPVDVNLISNEDYADLFGAPVQVTLTRDQKLDRVLGWFNTNYPQIFKA